MLGRSHFTIGLSLLCLLGYGLPANAQDEMDLDTLERSVSGKDQEQPGKTPKLELVKKFCAGDADAASRVNEMAQQRFEMRTKVYQCVRESFGDAYFKAATACGAPVVEAPTRSDPKATLCDGDKPRKVGAKSPEKQPSEAIDKEAAECLGRKGLRAANMLRGRELCALEVRASSPSKPGGSAQPPGK